MRRIVDEARAMVAEHSERIVSVAFLLYIGWYLLFTMGGVVFPAQPALATYHLPTFGERLALPDGSTTIRMGNTREIPVRLSNPIDRREVFELSVETSPPGVATAAILAGDTEGGGSDTVRVEVDADSTRVIRLAVTGASCYGSSCSATITLRGEALRAGVRVIDTKDVVVQRNTAVHRAPGITLPYAILIMLAAAALYVRH